MTYPHNHRDEGSARHSAWQLPAGRALVIQCAAAVVTLIIFLLAWMIGLDLPVLLFLILQGAIASVASRKIQLAPWWTPIQFFFPIAVWAAQSLQLPSGFFLAGFVFLAIFYWTTFRTQVPFYPSRPAVWAAIDRLLPAHRPLRVLDAGSGIGGMIVYLAARHPDACFTGIEAAPLPWLISRIRKNVRSSNSRFIFGDYNHLDFAEYDVLFAYLSPAAMPSLWQKARAEMRPGTLLLSHEFPIPEVVPHIRLQPGEAGPILYGWHM